MSEFVRTHLPCPSPTCDSSDAYAIAEDGHGYCFSCQHYVPPVEEEAAETNNPPVFSLEYLPWRNITQQTMRFYDVKTRIDDEGQPHSISFPYSGDAAKFRRIDSKSFWSQGQINAAGLFGANRFSGASAKAITICEGELDTLSAFQMLGSQYPVVSVQSASSAKRDCSVHHDYLNSFDRIYLCFDNDEAGKRAVKDVAALFNYNKVFIVKLTLKDANEYLKENRVKEFRNIWYNSTHYLPDNVISSLSVFDEIINQDPPATGVPFPFECLNDKLFGLRPGEVTLVTALEGVGKTELVRAFEYQVLTQTDDPVAIIHLEEGKARTLKGLAGLHLDKPCHIPNSGVTPAEVSEAIKRIATKDDRLFIYSHFGSDDPDVILGIIRFLVAVCGCKYVFFDHITMVTSGSGEDERVPLDQLSTKLAMLVEELVFSLVLVSHVNDNGQTRGSRNISKIAHNWIHLTRDLEATSANDRNTTQIRLKKNRFFGETGPAGTLVFDREAFRLRESSDIFLLPPVENETNPQLPVAF